MTIKQEITEKASEVVSYISFILFEIMQSAHPRSPGDQNKAVKSLSGLSIQIEACPTTALLGVLLQRFACGLHLTRLNTEPDDKEVSLMKLLASTGTAVGTANAVSPAMQTSCSGFWLVARRACQHLTDITAQT